MVKEKGLGPVKRFGVRYGATTKHRLADIEKEQKSPQMCPYCLKPKVKRLAYGIYECRKCASKFAGNAYTVGRKTKQYEIPLEEQAQKKEQQGIIKKEEVNEEE